MVSSSGIFPALGGVGRLRPPSWVSPLLSATFPEVAVFQHSTWLTDGCMLAGFGLLTVKILPVGM